MRPNAILTLLAAGLMSGAAFAESGAKLYESFQLHTHDGKSPTFEFSAAYATSESPVIVSVPGRKLTSDDRVYRTDLQKEWIHRNVPRTFTFRFRDLAECALKRKGEYSFCDRYSFNDPETSTTHDYYIYIGNWP